VAFDLLSLSANSEREMNDGVHIQMTQLWRMLMCKLGALRSSDEGSNSSGSASVSTGEKAKNWSRLSLRR